MLGNRDDARDAYQETFTKAFRTIGRFRGQSTFYTWIFRIAADVCVDHLKERQKSRPGPSIDTPRSDDTGNGLKENAAQLSERIKEGLNALSTRERLVLELKHQQGLKLKQIGEIVGSTEDGVKNYLCRAVQKLREQLAPLFVRGHSEVTKLDSGL